MTRPYGDLHMTGAMWQAVAPQVVKVKDLIATNDVYEEDVTYKVKHPRVSDYGDPFVHVVAVRRGHASGFHLYVEDGNTRVAAALRRGDRYISARVLCEF